MQFPLKVLVWKPFFPLLLLKESIHFQVGGMDEQIWHCCYSLTKCCRGGLVKGFGVLVETEYCSVNWFMHNAKVAIDGNSLMHNALGDAAGGSP